MTLGDKKDGMDMSFKGVWGYHGHLAGQHGRGALPEPAGQRREPRGRGRGLGKAILAPHVERVCLRGDTDLGDGQLRPMERGGRLHFRDSQPGMVRRAKALEAGDERLERLAVHVPPRHGAGGRT